MTKSYVVKESMKNAKQFFEGEKVLKGKFNGKQAIYVSSGYFDEELNGEEIFMYSAKSTNCFIGAFVGEELIDIKEAKGIVLIAK